MRLFRPFTEYPQIKLEKDQLSSQSEVMIDSTERGEGSLEYGMLGFDDSSDEDKIEKYMGEVEWSYLAPHLVNGALFHLDSSLDLVETAKLFTEDDKNGVQALLKKGDLTKMDHLHAEWFEKNPQTFSAVVVTPFVLCQPAK